MNETNLEQSPFNVKEQNFRTLLIESIQVLKCCEVKKINFWDLKVFECLKLKLKHDEKKFIF